MKIYIKSLIGGKVLEMNVGKDVTVGYLKKYLCSVYPTWTPKQMTLTYNGKALTRMEWTVGRYGVKDKSTLEVIPIGLIWGLR